MFGTAQSTMTHDDAETEFGTKLCPYCVEEVRSEAVKCKHCHSWIGSGWFGGKGRGASKPGQGLRRTVVDRKGFGVCGGLAKAKGLDPTVVRVVYALATVFTGIGPGAIAYLVMAMVIPNEDDPSEVG